MKMSIKLLAVAIIALLFGFCSLVGYATLSDYQPAPETIVYENPQARTVPGNRTLNLMIWNIGYAGLSSDMDFFYDGGRQVRPDLKRVQANVTAIESFLSVQKDQDFILLQEVDQHSKRSWSINQYEKIGNIFPGFHSSFGKNYDVFFVPLPLKSPMGHVLSGLQTLSRFEPVEIVRHSFPGNFSWPQGLFMLDRCFLVSRFTLEKGNRQLVVVNTHNSAYDDGTLRQQQMDYLESFLSAEYSKGNFVIVGGDWNQCPPAFEPQFEQNLMDNDERMDIPESFMPQWLWAYDRTIPTNRRVKTPYNSAHTLTTLIDYFLVSPNIIVKKVAGHHMGFENSDHQPVFITVELKNDQDQQG